MSDARDKWLPHIYREVDGYYYYMPPPNGGAYAAHILRAIANELDAMNKEWDDTINREIPTLPHE